MKAWARLAGKLARYEHIGWKLWPQSRCWSFHSGSKVRCGSSLGSCRASWPSVVAVLPADRAVMDRRSRVIGTSARSESSESDATIAPPTNTARGRLVTEEVRSLALAATGNDGTKGRVARLSRRTMPRCMLCWLELRSTPCGGARRVGCPPACSFSPGAMLTTASARIAPRPEHRRSELSVESDSLAPSACDLCDSPYFGSPGMKLSRRQRPLEGPRGLPVLFAGQASRSRS